MFAETGHAVLRRILRVRGRQGVRKVAVPVELADDVIDWSLRENIDELQSRLVYGLGRDKLPEKPNNT